MEQKMEKQFRYEVNSSEKSWLDEQPLNKKMAITVVVLNKTYYKEDSGFGIYSVCEDKNPDHRFKINGIFPMPLVDENHYYVEGVVSKGKHGFYLKISSYRWLPPQTKKSILKYLEDFDKINYYGDALFETFGKNILAIIEKTPLSISNTIPDIGVSLALQWQKELCSKMEKDKAISLLFNLGLNPYLAKKILVDFGPEIVEKIESDPYFLVRKVPTISFSTWDNMALKNGYPLSHTGRYREGILFILNNSAENGDCYVEKDLLMKECVKLFSYWVPAKTAKRLIKQQKSFYKKNETRIPVDLKQCQLWLDQFPDNHQCPLFLPEEKDLTVALDQLIDEKIIVEEDCCLYLFEIWRAERFILQKIKDLSNKKRDIDIESDSLIWDYLSKKDVHLEKEQFEAVKKAFEVGSGVMILNGGPGCGKTFTINIILDLLKGWYKERKEPFSVKLLAPTGKAAKVLQNATQHTAETIHRGLCYQEDGSFKKKEDDPFEASLIIVDESSMIDLLLMASLLKAVPSQAKIIFVGDERQLPPIGPGNPFIDFIKSNAVDIVTLKAPKRQLENSGIVYNAKKIAQFEMIETTKNTQDFFVFKKESEEAVLDLILRSTKVLNETNGIPLSEIQVLTPQKAGLLGTHLLNCFLQEQLNPYHALKPQVFKQEVVFYEGNIKKVKNLFLRVGDRVIHTKNNYKKQWYFENDQIGYQRDFSQLGIVNGECGIVKDVLITTDLGVKKERVVVEYDDGYVFYENDFSEIEHAFALTIHKSQGSQWRSVIIPIYPSFALKPSMITNQLIYTACTRSRVINIIIGNPDLIKKGILRESQQKRKTRLEKKLKNME